MKYHFLVAANPLSVNISTDIERQSKQNQTKKKLRHLKLLQEE